MTTIILVRHGETAWNQTRRIQGGGSNTRLNESGRKQAECIAERLKDERIEAIYSSPLERAMETARPIAEKYGFEINVEPSLKEIEAGELEGVLLSELGERFSQVLTAARRGDALPKIPGGESLDEVRKRAWKAVLAIMDKHPDGTVAVVTHYFVILAVVCSVLDIPIVQIGGFRLGTASLTIIERKDDIIRLAGFNEACCPSEGQLL